MRAWSIPKSQISKSTVYHCLCFQHCRRLRPVATAEPSRRNPGVENKRRCCYIRAETKPICAVSLRKQCSQVYPNRFQLKAPHANTNIMLLPMITNDWHLALEKTATGLSLWPRSLFGEHETEQQQRLCHVNLAGSRSSPGSRGLSLSVKTSWPGRANNSKRALSRSAFVMEHSCTCPFWFEN